MTPDPVDRRLYALDFDDRFTSVDASRWLPHYLPHWTTPDRSAARFDLTRAGLRLRIDADQPAWREAGGGLRVSNLQSGSWSGPEGSPRGQHRHGPRARVVSPQPERRLYLAHHGLVEARLRAQPDPTSMLAFWLIGFEAESADDCGEICVVELFGDSIGPSSSLSMGVKAHSDRRLVDDMARVPWPVDAADWHTYAAEWTPEGVRFFVDDQHVRTVAQRIDYPMQLMVDLFEFRPDGAAPPGDYPKIGEVGAVRAYRRGESRSAHAQ
jgi:hypothetical protein